MDERANNYGSLTARIEQAERERDELRKDIEQLCMQQAGPSYLVVATRMHFQRTAALEQEIENFKKKLAGCSRDNLNLQEELSEVYRIKSQLADLHSAEVSKNTEAEKQVKFFQGCMAAAFAERDHSLMEAEKAKEREEAMQYKLNDFQKRVEELTEDCLEEKKYNIALQNELMKLKGQTANFEKVIDKFYKIRQSALECFEDGSSEDKSVCLLHDPDEMWNFDDNRETSTSKYIVSLEEEIKVLRNSVATLQNRLRMGLEFEEHLRNKACSLEKRILSEDQFRTGLSMLHHFHIQHRSEVMSLLEEEKVHIKLMFDEVQEKIMELHMSEVTNYGALQRDEKCDDLECRDVHMTDDVNPFDTAEGNVLAPSDIATDSNDTSNAFAQALQEKVSALLLLSQQEERHLLEKDVYAALEKKMEELQKNLFQVTNEKVKALMELAQLRQEYQQLWESISDGTKRGNFLVHNVGNRITGHERDGKIKNLLKRTYLKRWIGRLDLHENLANLNANDDERSSIDKNQNYAVDFARLKVENAALQESIVSMEHLTSTIHKLRLALLKATESATSSDPDHKPIEEALDNIIFEANLVKTALGSSLPVSWSADADPASQDTNLCEIIERSIDSGNEKLDCVSAVGFEFVELLMIAAQLQKDKLIERNSRARS